jgi:hypothetical protein
MVERAAGSVIDRVVAGKQDVNGFEGQEEQ